ncbi:MAG: alkaline phosphatase family protein [Candidatus Brocadiales bacterium]|nr:alkaline phosphatase family protein [Candidatus Brocadiales bacterium]
MNYPEKVVVIGLDGAPPELVFQRWINELPTFKWLTDHGVWGELKSTIPSITCPAWLSMVTGKDPGSLGIYGFRNRTHYDYKEMSFVDSSWIKEETLWDYLSKLGRRVVLLGVPPSYPPRPVNGYMVSCFLAGDTSTEYTFPKGFKPEVEALSGGYILDVKDFRTDNKGPILESVYQMTQRRLRLAKALLKRNNWDLFMLVEMGPDRIQHAFWRYFDEAHKRFCPNTEYQSTVLAYYKYLDREIGEILNLLDDRTTLLVVSDHGAKRMEGGICINEWLVANGYLRLFDYPKAPTSFKDLKVDWRRTVAWGESGFYGRLFLNVKGREPWGVIPRQDYERVRNEIAQGLEDIRDENGRRLKTKAFRPEEIYPECSGIPPDLIVYFGDQYWRSIGSVGHGRLCLDENDTGPDYANHSQYGIFLMYNNNLNGATRRAGLHIQDVAPTILRCIGVEVPPGMEGDIVN